MIIDVAFCGVKSVALVLLFVVFPTTAMAKDVRHYRNPLDVFVADPQILKDGDTFYLYGTTDSPNGIEVHTSKDLVHWRRYGHCYKKTKTSWGQDCFWAPEVIKAGETYYLFYTAFSPVHGVRNICVATSDSALGPFLDVKTPVLPVERGFIDGHPFFDPVSGRHYLYALEENLRPPQLVVARLSEDLTRIDSEITLCFEPSQPWEYGWVEGAFVIYHKSAYYMTYSGCGYQSPNYAVGYATAPSPTGPWTKYEGNPVLAKSAAVSGPGHNSLVLSPDGRELFIVYHRHLTFFGGWQRELAIDRVLFRPNRGCLDTLTIPGAPTHDLQPLPSGSRPHRVGCSDDFEGLDLDWSRWTVFGEDSQKWRLENGCLCIETQNGDVYRERVDGRNIFLQYAPPGDFCVSTKVEFEPEKNVEQAILTIWQDQSNYLKLACVMVDSKCFEAAREIGGHFDSVLVPNPLGSTFHMQIRKKGTHYTYSYSADGVEWTEIGSGFDATLQNIKFGIGAMSPPEGATRLARFHQLEIESSKQSGKKSLLPWKRN